MTTSVGKADFKTAPQWESVFKQDTGAGLGVYVDDFELVAPKGKSAAIWKELEKHIELKEPPKYWGKEPTRHLGCHYSVEQRKVATGDTITTIEPVSKCQMHPRHGWMLGLNRGMRMKLETWASLPALRPLLSWQVCTEQGLRDQTTLSLP